MAMKNKICHLVKKCHNTYNYKEDELEVCEQFN